MTLLLATLLSAAAADLPNKTEAAGVTFRWQVDGEQLIGELHAETTGWVLVGFNDHPGLAGSRLIFAAVTPDGAVRVEEHRADPPVHHAVAVVPAEQTDVTLKHGAITARFQIPLARDGLLTLTPGQPFTAWLAWSHDPDLQHHSARRERVDITL